MPARLARLVSSGRGRTTGNGMKASLQLSRVSLRLLCEWASRCESIITVLVRSPIARLPFWMQASGCPEVPCKPTEKQGRQFFSRMPQTATNQPIFSPLFGNDTRACTAKRNKRKAQALVLAIPCGTRRPPPCSFASPAWPVESTRAWALRSTLAFPLWDRRDA